MLIAQPVTGFNQSTPKLCSRFRHAAVVVCALLAISSQIVWANEDQTPSITQSMMQGKSTLALTDAGGQAIGPIHQTANQIIGPKVVRVRGEAHSMLIATWQEVQPADNANEDAVPYYAVSVDGKSFAEARPADYRIQLRLAQADPLKHVLPSELRNAVKPNGDNALPLPQQQDQASLYIVQFFAPPNDVMMQQIQQLGAQPRAYLPQYAHVVEMTEQVRQQVEALDAVRWVGPYRMAYRMDESLVNELGGLDVGQAMSKPINRVPTRRYSIMLFERGPAVQQIVENRINALGGVVNARIASGFRIEATLTASQLLEIAAMNHVQFIDQWGPPGIDMNIARQIGGAVPLLSNLGFTGHGVRGEVMDEGYRPTHVAFQNPPSILHGGPPSGVLNHGTATYGIVFGNGASNASGTGMLPNREQGFFASFFTLTPWQGPDTRYDHTEELVDPAGPYRVVFQSNSWGSASGTAYTTISAEFDDILFINDLITCQSQSNNGTQVSRPEAWSKNTVSVGGVAHKNTLDRADDAWTAASFGPAADGRVKPDLTHFYENVLCPTGSSDTAYTTTFNGTSAATPIVCGHFGLIFQMWHEEVFDGFGGAATVFESRPRLATAKALMINSAYRYNWLNGGFNGNLTRAKQGWGMPDLARLYNDRSKLFVVNCSDPLTPFESLTYQLQVGAGEPELRATLVYTDLKGNPASSRAIVNDLSLRVTSPGGTEYWGNNGLVASNYSTPGGSSNIIDNVENVFIQNPQAGTWTFTVFADAIVQDARPQTPELDADYALVLAGIVSPVACPADIDLSGDVNANDLLAVINAWGACPLPPLTCSADINGDNVVNANDLLMVINAWGACP